MQIPEEAREALLSRSEEEVVRVRCRLFGERGHVQAPQTDANPPCPIVIGDLVRTAGVRDVDLDDDQLRVVIQGQGLDVLVDDDGLVLGVEVGRQRRQAEGWEEAVLDRSEEWALCLGEGRKDELDLHGSTSTKG